MRQHLAGLLVAALAVGLAAEVQAQGRGGRGGGARGGGGVQRAALLRIEAVQEELGLEDIQIEDIRAMQRELRGDRGQRGERPNLRDMSQEERAEATAAMRSQATERQKAEYEKLTEILDGDQIDRLNGIIVQVAGPAAMMDPIIGEKLGITADQRDEMQTIARDAMSEIRDAFQAGDRDGMREKMTEIQADIAKQSVAILTESQRTQLDEMKGEPFELSEEDQTAMRGGRGGRGGGAAGGGRGGRGGAGGGAQRRGRPQTE